MSGKRRKARKKRQQQARLRPLELDVHGEQLLESMEALESIMGSIAGSGDPVAEVSERFDAAIGEFVDRLGRFEAMRLVEVARMAVLPWMREGQFRVVADASAAHVELLALMALATEAQRGGPPGGDPVEVQEMSGFIAEATGDLDQLLNLSHLRVTLATDPSDKLAMISLLVRGSQVMVRNSSYDDMVERTVLEILDGDDTVRTQLVAGLGFDAHDAMEVLKAVHRLQQDQVNARGEVFAATLNMLREEVDEADAEPSEELTAELQSVWLEAIGKFFEPDLEGSTVGIDDIVAVTGMDHARVRAVVERFAVDVVGQTPAEVVDAFMAGDNPLRPRPLIAADGGERVMLPHDTLTMDAVKENLEDYLKTSSVWETYQSHRGDQLELRVRATVERVLPGAVFREAFKYFVPANKAEEAGGDPAKYTKKVESDHLVTLDDVAFIIEDKAVALSALAKSGKTQRLRTDLTSIITKAADQAGRLRTLIERDGGVRSDDQGWVDLSDIREIHTIAVSLDDLMSVATATVELIRAGLLAPDNIPWTVSLHDLELIVELTARPAEFLLYLRRRRDPLTTFMFTAPDELDLFLFMYEGGLWVDPDPDLVRKAFPFLGPPTPGERRRFRKQRLAYLTSRTGQLDQWYYTRNRPDGPGAPKPEMFCSPVAPLVDDLAARGIFGWLSIGATLLGGSSGFQEQMARQAGDLLDAPLRGRGRRVAVPLAQSVNNADGWLLVWATRPVGADPDETEMELRTYLRTKKHQLGVPRGFLFLYDEGTRELVHAFYDGYAGELPDDLKPLLSLLQPPSAMRHRLPPNAKRPNRSKGSKKR